MANKPCNGFVHFVGLARSVYSIELVNLMGWIGQLYGMNSSSLTKLRILLFVDLFSLIMDCIKSSLWNELVLSLDFISQFTLIMGLFTCGPSYEVVRFNNLVHFIN